MIGLPFTADEKDIVQFFNKYSIHEKDIHIEKSSTKMHGVASVIFPDHDTARKAKKDLNKKYIGNRYIDLKFLEDEK